MEGIAVIDPHSMAVHVDGYGDMTADVARELHAMRMERLDREARVVDARQRLLARECGEAPLLPYGQVVGQVDEAVYQHWVDREGQAFWSDKANRRWFLRKHPECAVRAITKPTVRQSELPAYRVADRRSSAALIGSSSLPTSSQSRVLPESPSLPTSSQSRVLPESSTLP